MGYRDTVTGRGRIGLGAAGALATCAGIVTAWQCWGIIGAGAMLAGSSVAALAVLMRSEGSAHSVHQAHAHTEGRESWAATLAKFPPRTHYALHTLSDEWDAQEMWADLGIGRARTARDMGDWPRLLPGRDPGHAPDPGYRQSAVGVRVRLLLHTGPSRDDLVTRLPRLATALRVPKIGIVAADGETVTLELRVRNPLAATVPFEAPDDSPVDLKAVRVGRQEDLKPYRLQLQGTHIFIAGLTGAGKSGLLWAIIAGVAADVAAGRVQLHVIDLKKGSEMSGGYRLYSSWAWRVSEALALLENMVAILDERATPRREESMRTARPVRNHVPTPGDPQHILFIDEIIALLKLPGDRKVKANVPQVDGSYAVEEIRVGKYAALLLLELLSQARSFGITVVVATQNAAKEIFELLRDMFPLMVGLRMASEEQQRMVFSSGAAERGVAATEITTDEAGTIYIDSPEAGGSAIRARVYRVEDDDITELVNRYGRAADAPDLPALTLSTGDDDSEAKNTKAKANGGNVVEIRPHEAPLIEQTPAPSKCKFCGREIEQTPGGRKAIFCPNTDHRQKYHRLNRQLKKEAEGS